MQVYLTPSARQSLRDVTSYIERFSVPAAKRTRARILGRLRQLSEHPESGRIVPEYEVRAVRELIEGPYRVWYRLGNDRIEVLAILHGARQILDD